MGLRDSTCITDIVFEKMGGKETKACNNVFECTKLRMPKSVVLGDDARTFSEKHL